MQQLNLVVEEHVGNPWLEDLVERVLHGDDGRLYVDSRLPGICPSLEIRRAAKTIASLLNLARLDAGGNLLLPAPRVIRHDLGGRTCRGVRITCIGLDVEHLGRCVGRRGSTRHGRNFRIELSGDVAEENVLGLNSVLLGRTERELSVELLDVEALIRRGVLRELLEELPAQRLVGHGAKCRDQLRQRIGQLAARALER